MDRVEQIASDMARSSLPRKEKSRWQAKQKQLTLPVVPHDQATFGATRARKVRTPKEIYDEACRISDAYDLRKAEERRARRGQ